MAAVAQFFSYHPYRLFHTSQLVIKFCDTWADRSAVFRDDPIRRQVDHSRGVLDIGPPGPRRSGPCSLPAGNAAASISCAMMNTPGGEVEMLGHQNSCTHRRSPMDTMRQDRSTSLSHASRRHLDA
jgi:hypothetical protein